MQFGMVFGMVLQANIYGNYVVVKNLFVLLPGNCYHFTLRRCKN